MIANIIEFGVRHKNGTYFYAMGYGRVLESEITQEQFMIWKKHSCPNYESINPDAFSSEIYRLIKIGKPFTFSY